MIKNIYKYLPWFIKYFGSFMRILPPLNYFLRLLKIGKRGHMDNIEYAYNTFFNHFNLVKKYRKFNDGFKMLELGPGEFLFSALIGYLMGSKMNILVDVREISKNDIQFYYKMIDFLNNKNFKIGELKKNKNVGDLLKSINAKYFTSGLESLKKIKNRSINYIWSNAVLEHIDRNNFISYIKELRRIITDDGISSHWIGLLDHFNGKLNNLCVPNIIWDKNYWKKYGIYTNRIQYGDILRIFEKCGFKILYLKIHKWKVLPTKKNFMLSYFRNKNNLNVRNFRIILKPI